MEAQDELCQRLFRALSAERTRTIGGALRAIGLQIERSRCNLPPIAYSQPLRSWSRPPPSPPRRLCCIRTIESPSALPWYAIYAFKDECALPVALEAPGNGANGLLYS